MSNIEALLVLPHLQIQNANAISSPLTHGFPSITAMTGLMWALQRKLAGAGIALTLRRVGVICHDFDEQVQDGYVKTFRLTRNPVDRDGATAAIVEQGRMHLDLTLLFDVAQTDPADGAAPAGLRDEACRAEWAARIGDIVAGMRVAGGSVLPGRAIPGRRTRPWIAMLPDDYEEQVRLFARWRRQWLPGYALVGRDDLLAQRHGMLREENADASLLDAWLHAARFNHQPLPQEPAAGGTDAAKRVRWGDPLRPRGSGWIVPIPVGYAALTKPQAAGQVANTRDPATPFVWVESIYSLGQWIGPHRVTHWHELLWQPETDTGAGLYRCRSAYRAQAGASQPEDDELPDFD
ncbi:type I-F CRISPR-associated protein Csy2 [Burkholderia glumae]|uniref:type I-F CRISPR-associated protein Csy2 n=1 Tax=Burkholderia glumae TaxID=337 RepID=UPI0003A4E802|nr:type I-F CRISPR-associated protein Csy2 [Burkholderia glumae]MCM2546508.1 type I-F CRISPR-associated protein Csy2 [Burkholderia glumae]